MSDTENYASESSEPQTSPLQAFFAGFAATGFTYKPSRSTKKNFDHLCKVSGWAGNSPARTAARQDFKDALVQEFNFLFGISGDDIAAWHKLCKAIKIDPAPDSVDECRKLVWDAHVNIVDLIEAVRMGREVQQFNSLDDLARYTKSKDRFFPKENAYQGGLLKELLREIINPYFGQRRNGSQKRKARKARKREAAAAAAAAATSTVAASDWES